MQGSNLRPPACRDSDSGARSVAPSAAECREPEGHADVDFSAWNHGKPSAHPGVPSLYPSRERDALASNEFLARFSANVGEPDANGCRPWLGAYWTSGYGSIKHRYKALGAHRIAFVRANGYAPPVVMHSCDNRACVEPSHLLPGTVALNNQDRQNKGRQARGTRNGSAKLTPAAIAEARELRAAGMTYRKLGERFGVSHVAIRNALVGKNWTVAA